MSSLSLLPVDILDTHILSFLIAQDVHRFHSTSQEMRAKIRNRRPFLVSRAQQRPTKMGVEPWDSDGSNGKVIILQLEYIFFIVQTPDFGPVHLELVLANEIWEERFNVLCCPSMCRPLSTFPRPTFVFRLSVSSKEREMFHYGQTSYDPPRNVDHYWLDRSDEEEDIQVIEETVRCTTKCIELCTKYLASHLEKSGERSLPSAEYIVQSLPENLHGYFAPALVASEATDRSTTVDFQYRQAPDVDAWAECMLEWETMELDRDHLPWWYNEEDSDMGSSGGDDEES